LLHFNIAMVVFRSRSDPTGKIRDQATIAVGDARIDGLAGTAIAGDLPWCGGEQIQFSIWVSNSNLWGSLRPGGQYVYRVN
jgi:hypothetical protein